LIQDFPQLLEINLNFTDAAIETFGKIGQRRKWKQDDSKPWFDKNCSKNRKKIRLEVKM
jgi:hypothetical protein